MNLHIMLTSSTYTAGPTLGNSLSSFSMHPHWFGATPPIREEAATLSRATRWVIPRPLCAEAMPMRVAANTISHEAIANLAYLFYLQDGSPDGKSEEHWLQAELFLNNLAS